MIDTSIRKTKERVEKYSEYYYYSEQQSGIDNKTKQYLFDKILPHVKGDSVLEFGYVDGIFTDMLLDTQHTVTLVEGATVHIKHAVAKYGKNPKIFIEQALFEEYSTDQIFDTVIAGDMIQFLANPVDFLRRCRHFLRKGGQLIVTTPNCRSLHRRVGAYLYNTDPCAISEHEKKTGTIKLYDEYSLRHLLEKSGFTINVLKGCFLKPLSSKQIENWDQALLDAFAAIGNETTDIAWFLYAVSSLDEL